MGFSQGSHVHDGLLTTVGTAYFHLFSSSSFSLLINGEASSNIIPQRGLRQGCPSTRLPFVSLSFHFMHKGPLIHAPIC